MSRLQTFAIRTKGYYDDHETIVVARTSGQAKSIFWRSNHSDFEFPFTSMRARRVNDREPAGFRNCAEYRGFPWVKIGQRVHVSRYWGNIVGHNGSANWNVLVDGGSLVLNCHPRSEITYYDDAGKIIEAYNVKGERIDVTAGGVQ